MNFELLNRLGLNFDYSYVFIALLALILILFILCIVNLVKYSNLKRRYEVFMRGKNAKSMEREIGSLFEDISELKNDTETHNKEIRHIYKRLETMFQKIGLVKYDAYQTMGGKLSFSLCLLDEANDGFIINSVHSTEGCFFYVKEIKEGESKITLSEEEDMALRIATNEI